MAVTLESLDLAALLCSRVCHDLISPAGAIVNGLEVLEEAKDEETKTFALDLIKKSARTASARLQFCRHRVRRRRLGRRADRYRRRRERGARLYRGRQDQAHLESAARAAAEEPGQAPAQHAGGRRPGDPARRHAHASIRSARARPWAFRITATGAQRPRPAGGPGPARRRLAGADRRCPCDPAVSTPACWRAPAGSPSTIAAEGDAIVVAAQLTACSGSLRARQSQA